MIAVRAPLPGDLETIGKDAAEAWVRDRFRNGADFSGLLDRPFSNVATIDDHPVAAGGFIERGNDLAIAWSILGRVEPECFVGLVRVFRKHIMAAPYKWIEAHCIATFHQSHRWVKCLGFEPVNGERCFTADGREFRKFVFRNDRHGT
ncbi:hypothetical protein CO683_00840 [Bradyrhizobium ottawaense]|uniref:hypothetical protein n=1 Tax=Bradyrhizobium ottawaense TaxID=931866 RepID=UPI000BE82917|nr:hypothetical protein [Bradyrhizobium ottawaense]PDT71738.1 hypothetical protein CO683_00840 [Bradyrhizobium ottawaense]